MTEFDKKEIARIVRQVLNEASMSSESAGNRPSRKQPHQKNGPAVLNIFHAGVRLLDEALKQIQQIDEASRRSSVYTVDSARSWVCGADVKEGAGIKCILDTVKPEGLEKALQKADILVLPTFCLQTAARVASLICNDQESGLVFKALLQGKPVLAANDGFMLYDILANEALGTEIDQILKKLERFGVVFCPTDQLHSTFKQMITGLKTVQRPPRPQKIEAKGENSENSVNLITAKVIYSAVDEKQSSLTLAPGGVVTPLASDLAKEYSIKIIRNT